MTGQTIRGTVVIDTEACKGCDLCIDACKPGVLAMTTDRTNTRGYRFPELLVGCTGCRACADVCPDFCFQVYRFNGARTWSPEEGLR
ncbi:MAG: 4Fe-4S dicluster domain-containing protein [Microthrixaceae bacterium]|nr:4Fe-4S dicluster domain-containing protein [Microthrixaceae bacterium]MCB1011864.1 4Fe-4S dicluster domain-containing protein [Microthrixaceae bacterium]MCO5322341.1 4Fe-4S binding protein [Microthrixaceae bacterium]